MLAKDHKKEFYIRGYKLTATIAPCSWMYPTYGLQLSVKLEKTGEQAQVHSNSSGQLKGLKFDDATPEMFDALLGAVYLEDAPCPCGNPRLRALGDSTNRGELCEVCFISKLDADFQKAQQKELRKIARRDQKMKGEGYTHKVVAWVHGGGDDKCYDIYFKGEPSLADIGQHLKRSVVKDDYRVSLL